MIRTNKKIRQFFCTAVFAALIFCMLTNAPLSLYYAFTGLTLWFDKMIPSLLPFMILSGVIVRLQLTEDFVTVVYPFVRPLFRVHRNVCYVMVMGFLCGFPMGAKCVGDLYSRGMISRREAQYLLAFCNNIGPVYFCSFVLPLLGLKKVAPYVFGMYGIPLLYGLVLRYTRYRGIGIARGSQSDVPKQSYPKNPGEDIHYPNPASLPEQLEDSIHSSLQSIAMLGGYMVLFNLLNLLPHLILGAAPRFLAPVLEITGGLQMLGQSFPLYSLLALPFGGLSCIAQTYSCISGTDLELWDYVINKLALTFVTALWYGLCGVFGVF